VTLHASSQATELASIGAEDADQLGSEARLHDCFGGALSCRFIACHHQAGNNAMCELEQMRFPATVLTVNHIDGAKAKIRLGEHRKVLKAESSEHQ
jgi:hypothetical protein